MPRKRKLPFSGVDHPEKPPFYHYDEWLKVMENRHFGTASNYASKINALADWLQFNQVGTFSKYLEWPLDESQLSEDMVLEFIVDVSAIRGSKTVSGYVSAIKSFLMYLDIKNELPESFKSVHDLNHKVRYFTKRREDKHAQSKTVAKLDSQRQELPRIIDYYCNLTTDDTNYNRHLIVIRNRALCAFLIHTGVRAQEASDITVGQIKGRDGEFDYYLDDGLKLRPMITADDINWEPVIVGKGGKWRTIFLKDTKARQLLIEYLNALDSTKLKPNTPLFKAFSGPYLGGTLTRKAIHDIIKRAVNALGLHPKLSAHDCRHYYAVSLVRQGLPMEILQDILGHDDISTTKGTYAAVARVKDTSEWLDRLF